jgi:predicted extracellular nuclease
LVSNPNTSEGLFVYTGETSINLQPGDVVCARGKVQEFYNLTQLKVEDGNYVKQSETTAPEAVAMQIAESDATFDETLERYEGMLVKTSQEPDMRVTRTFGFDYAARRNNMVLAQGRPNMQPNQNNVAGSDDAKAQAEENAHRRLFVESDAKAPNGVIPYYPDFGRTDVDQDGSTEDYIRIDDTVVGLEGVISYSFGDYRLIATNTLNSDNFVHNDPRTEKPKLKRGGDLRIATFNVLNYFNSPQGGDQNPRVQNRGANKPGEFEVQQDKIVDAILRLDADTIGLMEIENNGFGQGAAIRQLVEELNKNIDKKHKQYQFVSLDTNEDGTIDEMDYVGTDAITTGVIYRSAKVKPKKTRVIPMPRQDAPPVLDDDGKNFQRDSFAPTFKVKGTKCWEDAAPVDQGGQDGVDVDKQGSCEAFRVAAAVALGDAMKEIKGDFPKYEDHFRSSDHDPAVLDLNMRGASIGFAGLMALFGLGLWRRRK